MEQNETIRKILPPRVIDSITNGVSRLEKQPYLLIFPILFDLALWLGPQFSIKNSVEALYSQFLQSAESVYQIANIDIQPLVDLQTILVDFLSGYNLLSVLKTFPVGIPGLLANADTSVSPLGLNQAISFSSPGSIILISLILAFIGIFLGSIYLNTASHPFESGERSSFINKLLNSLIYSGILISVIYIGFLAALFISSFFAIFLPLMGQFIFLSLIMAMIFLLLPSLYAFIPIYLYGQSFYQAILTSYRVVGLRFKFKIDEENSILLSPKIVPFSMAIIIMYQGLNIVWQIAPIDSWWMVLGIIGHGFISTLILLSCFDFFQQMCAWHQRMTHDKVC